MPRHWHCCWKRWTAYTARRRTGAQEFYQRLGLPRLPSKLFYRATGLA